MGVYIPTWFNIKIKHHWTEGPKNLLFQLKLLRMQRKEIVNITWKYVQRSAWNGHSETILQSMLCSNDEEERRWAVDKILSIRGDEGLLGNTDVRYRITPMIDLEANELKHLIDWDESNIYEPLLTCSLTKTELRKLYDAPMQVPAWSSHTQAVERCIKLVTDAAATVFGHEQREGYIKAQQLSRKLMRRNNSKKDVVKLLDF